MKPGEWAAPQPLTSRQIRHTEKIWRVRSFRADACGYRFHVARGFSHCGVLTTFRLRMARSKALRYDLVI
jgi:hypothetical protein